MKNKYEVLMWVRKLYSNNIRQYAHAQLPDELKNTSLQRKAVFCDLVRKCGTTRIQNKNHYITNIYEIRNDIMELSLYNCHR